MQDPCKQRSLTAFYFTWVDSRISVHLDMRQQLRIPGFISLFFAEWVRFHLMLLLQSPFPVIKAKKEKYLCILAGEQEDDRNNTEFALLTAECNSNIHQHSHPSDCSISFQLWLSSIVARDLSWNFRYPLILYTGIVCQLPPPPQYI